MNMTPNRRLQIGLFGTNGHQVHHQLIDEPLAVLAACHGYAEIPLPGDHPDRPQVRVCRSLGEMLSDERLDLVVLCSPVRAEQAGHALEALRAGKHVFAEKPCALNEEDLDLLLRESADRGLVFREMADSSYIPVYRAMKEVVLSGVLGEIVQVTALKSYPWRDSRPQDESTDGGLVRQCALHAARWIEHVAGRKIASVQLKETCLGNPVGGGQSRMAANLLLTLDNGGVAGITANYLNQPGTGVHGYESLVIHGTGGLVESLRGGQTTRLVVGGTDHGELRLAGYRTQFRCLLEHLASETPMPMTVEEEVSPTRWMIRAKESLAA